MIRRVGDAFHGAGKKVIVLLNTSAPIEVAGWENDADGILWTGLPGEQGGAAIADILSGKVNPSGKLAETWPVHYSDVPDYGILPKSPHTPATYSEGIYVGYRYYDTKNVKPFYHFGYGLSYTTFSYSNLALSKPAFDLAKAGETITVTATVKNTGKVAGREVAELYIHENNPVIDRPFKELKGFAKAKLLQPGETARVSFVIDKRALSYFKPDPITEAGWTADPANFTIYVGGTSDSDVLSQKGRGMPATLEAK